MRRMMIVLALAASAPACSGDIVGAVPPSGGDTSSLEETAAVDSTTPIDTAVPDTGSGDDSASTEVESDASDSGAGGDAADSSAADTAAPDTAVIDSGAADTAAPDTAVIDSGAADSASSDTGTGLDAGPDVVVPDVSLDTGDALACTARACTMNSQCKPGCGNCVSGFCANP